MLKQQLSTGCISVQSTVMDWDLNELFVFAERQNPKRSFLFVSKVLGRHIPVTPSLMRQVYQDLAQRIPQDLPSPLLFVGMAETAVGLAAGVFEEAIKTYQESVLLTTSRHPISSDILCEFKEEHSHATDHYVHWPTQKFQQQMVCRSKTLVLIDDEATTGNTFKNLIQALQQNPNLNHIEQIVTITLTDWSQDALVHLSSLPVTPLALAKGKWHWSANPEASLPIMPDVNVSTSGSVSLSQRQDWGRMGMNQVPNKDWFESFSVKPQERILVLGTGEFVYVPFLLSEHLEKQGAEVVYSSTSRSPIAVGLGIQSAFSFQDNYGLGIPNYCYNIAHQHYDRIILCLETPIFSLDPQFFNDLQRITNRLEVIEYV